MQSFNARDLATLAVCARVCRDWFAEAAPLLWFHREYNTFDAIMALTGEPRKQIYSKYISRSTIVCDFNGPIPDCLTDELADLRFTRLAGMHMMVTRMGNGANIPVVAASNLAWVHLHPYYLHTPVPMELRIKPETWSDMLHSLLVGVYYAVLA